VTDTPDEEQLASNSQNTILAAFQQASSGLASVTGGADLSRGLLPLVEQNLSAALAQTAHMIDAQTQATSANTDALAMNSQSRGSSTAASELAKVAGSASQFLGGGLSLMPLVSLFSSFFGGGEPQQAAPLTTFSLPAPVSLEYNTNRQSVSWSENGLPRAMSPQITVQVQAMDSQSFLDHSHEIAQAVRQAMLNMNTLNDVVTSL